MILTIAFKAKRITDKNVRIVTPFKHARSFVADFYTAGIIALLIVSQSFGHEIKISNDLTVHKLSEHSYIHSQKNNNGLVYINHHEALIVSTPASDIETQNLIDWVRNQKHAKIIGYMIDRWHPDAMEGLDVVQRNGIKNYAYQLTRQIAKEKGLPVPDIGFDPKLIMKVGGSKVICHFLGAAHTPDGIVVWIPDEKILFGGNEIRNNHGWIGNISDANLDAWSQTASKIKKEYGSAKIVIPGHGKYGGPELIDYTINLYKFPENKSAAASADIPSVRDLKFHDDVFIQAESSSQLNDKQVLKKARVIVRDQTKYVEITSPHIDYQTAHQKIDSQTGRLKIYDRKNDQLILRTDVNYQKLIVFKVDDAVGFVVILKDITHKNHHASRSDRLL